MNPGVIRPLVAGNWKMNGLGAQIGAARELAEALAAQSAPARVAICAPATLVERLARALEASDVLVGGEDCHPDPSGAHTGDVSAEMLADAGARMVILGHSERRAAYGETDALVARKVRAALRAGLEPIVCVGETRDEHEAGLTLDVIRRQARGSLPPELRDRAFALAYEPVWAIGSGLTPTVAQIEEAHATLRGALAEALGDSGRAAPILFGGSVSPSNAAEILHTPGVNGALVGGASLKPQDFLAIVRAA